MRTLKTDMYYVSLWYKSMCENSHENARKIKKRGLGTSLVGPVVKTLISSAGGMGMIPGQGTKIPVCRQGLAKNKD